MASILINERQLELITKDQASQKTVTINESEWYNTVGDILGIVDPTGVVDLVNGISYFSQGDHLFGLLSIISVIPYAGDVVAKPVMGALKIGGGATKGLTSAMKLAKVGKTAEASAALAKLAEKPGVVGKFLQSAKSWAPKVASKIEQIPAGPLKGFKNTILDYLKLLENAGAKSLKFQKNVGNLSTYIGHAAKPAENIKALQSMLKNEKIMTGLTKKGPMAKIFLGGAPRLFGNREMRILMRRTKFWLGFLDYINVGNFVGPEELSKKMGQANVQNKMAEYARTPQGIKNAQDDFGNAQYQGDTPSQSSSGSSSMGTPSSEPQSDPIQGFMSDIFGGQLKNAAMLAL
jgi:hypothetical protein